MLQIDQFELIRNLQSIRGGHEDISDQLWQFFTEIPAL